MLVLSLHLSKCCIVGNHMSWLICLFLDTDYPGMNEVTLLTAVTVFVLFGAELINKAQALYNTCMKIYLDCWQSSDTEVRTSSVVFIILF